RGDIFSLSAGYFTPSGLDVILRLFSIIMPSLRDLFCCEPTSLFLCAFRVPGGGMLLVLQGQGRDGDDMYQT
ncbi:MAG TPA: hypothetical protein VJ440_01715, partial [Candidatus Brocadiaceae bacterium]|nr:hypothetical protein [Candidatus Brocadiaceae bacterium]